MKTQLASVLVAGALSVGGAVLAAPAASAEPQPTPFQIQTTVLADLPSPVIGTTHGPGSGQATVYAQNTHPTAGATAGPLGVHWLSLGTGAAGFAGFDRGSPPPVVITPGAGPVVAVTVGGIWPGFGFFDVH